MVLRLGMIMLMVGLAVTGCGRKGALETPRAAAAEAAKPKMNAAEAVSSDSTDPGAVKPSHEAVTPRKPFILDGLI